MGSRSLNGPHGWSLTRIIMGIIRLWHFLILITDTVPLLAKLSQAGSRHC
jgi:hypothetical protein